MRFLVKVRVDLGKMPEFGKKLQNGELDRSMIRSETFCLSEDPAVGYSVWEAESRMQFDTAFSAWKNYYAETQIREVVSAQEAMMMLMKR